VAGTCAGARAAPRPPLLAFASDRAPNLGSPRIYSVGVDGRDGTRIPSNAAESDVVASRDGTHIAFLRDGNVWVADASGAHARPITRTSEPKQDLAWSPDGRRLAFSVCADTSCRRGIEVVNADGSNPHRVVNDALQPTWSPDSRYLAYAGETQSFGDPSAIDVIPVAGGQQRRIAPLGTHPQWQPHSGKWILFDGACGNGGDLCVVRRDGFDRHVLADGDAAVWSPRGDRVAVVGNEVGLGIVRFSRPRRIRWIAHRVDISPAWSPDAKAIVYLESSSRTSIMSVRVATARTRVVTVVPHSATVTGLAYVGRSRLVYAASIAQNDLDLYSFRPGVKGVRELTANGVDERDPAWSFDGKKLAFVRFGASPRAAALLVADARTMHARRVVAETGALVSDPSWSPDGKTVVFVQRFEDTAETQVATVDVATLKVRIVPLPEAAYASPVFSPDGQWLALDADNVLSLVHPDGSGLHAVAPGTAVGAAWSPDGTRLATIVESSPGSFQLAVVDVADGTVQTIADDPDPEDGEPAWSPDGTRIVYARAIPTGSELVSVAADGTGAQVLTTASSANVDPAFVP